MNDTPIQLRYASTHEWARLEEDGSITVGITDFAQDALGDVVYVELPEIDAHVEIGAEVGVVESVKAASDIYAPVSGTVLEVNEKIEAEPEIVNQEPYNDGWFYKIDPEDTTELDELLDAEAYEELCEEQASEA